MRTMSNGIPRGYEGKSIEYSSSIYKLVENWIRSTRVKNAGVISLWENEIILKKMMTTHHSFGSFYISIKQNGIIKTQFYYLPFFLSMFSFLLCSVFNLLVVRILLCVFDLMLWMRLLVHCSRLLNTVDDSICWLLWCHVCWSGCDLKGVWFGNVHSCDVTEFILLSHSVPRLYSIWEFCREFCLLISISVMQSLTDEAFNAVADLVRRANFDLE